MRSLNAEFVATVADEGTPETNFASIDTILEQHRNDRTELVEILLDVQDSLGYLAVPTMEHVAHRLHAPLAEIYSIATFFKCFRLEPPGRHQCTVCTGTACHVRGAVKVLRELERDLGICAGEVTVDLEYSLETVNCVGACALGPVVIVDGKYRGQMTATKVPALLRRLQKAGEKPSQRVSVEAAP